jgi:hypothetical protein
MIEINERTALPKLLLEFVPGDHPPRFFQEDCQNLKRLSLQPHTGAVLGQLTRSSVKDERTEDP